MQPSYRVAPAPPAPTVVVYRPQPMWVALMISTIMLGMLAFMMGMAAEFMCTVSLDLSRPDDACTITSTYPVVGSTVERYPLSSVRGTRLVVTTGKHGSRSYEVQLTTQGAPIRMSRLQSALSRRQQQKGEIDAFLAGTAPTLHLVYDEASWTGAWVLLFSILPLFFLRFMWMRARVTIDHAGRTLRVERPRWPFRKTTESFPLGEVTTADVRETRGSKGGRVYRVVLVLTSGKDVPLLRQYTSAFSVHARAAERIKLALMQAVALVVLALAATGCHSTSAEVVQSLASYDFACPEKKIQVTPGHDKDTWHAEGCGKKGDYTCEGWDAYNQKPVCASSR